MTRRAVIAGCWLAAASFLAAADTAVLFDYSSAGYHGGGVRFPLVAARAAVEPSGGDDTEAIQRAIDQVGWRGAGTDGWRGAVSLRPGVFHVAGQLRFDTSGVVLRGRDSTIIATGVGRRTLILVDSAPAERVGPIVPVVSPFAVAGAVILPVLNPENFTEGDRVAVHRPSTQAWISDLGMDKFVGHFKEIRLDWLPGSRDLDWTRTVVAVDLAAHTITLDAPLTTALEGKFGGGTVQKINAATGLRQIGIENLILESEFRNERPADEEHSWIGVSLDHVDDGWIRGVTARQFAGIGFWIGRGASRVTLQDCAVESPIAERGGWRQMGLYIGGQQILAQRCEVDDCAHGFSAGHCAAGPNVFLDCTAVRAKDFSGAVESWAAGFLFDRVAIDGGALRLDNIGVYNQGAGWSAANCLAWNCAATRIQVENPPGANNLVRQDPAVASLYRAQLISQRGRAALLALQNTELVLDEATPEPATPPHLPQYTARQVLAISHGHFRLGDTTVFSGASNNAWWKGQLDANRAASLGTSITRWAPGRTGPGLTEDIAQLAVRLKASGSLLYHAWPGLWYDRRRDEHSTTLREDGDAWGPFFESPWARSGRGRGADGLSLYDLNAYNPWYDARLHEFAEAAAHQGLVLVHYFYNNHNLEESSAHWAEFPWRPINTLQATGFPEPPPFEGPNRNTIHVAQLFYDIDDPVRRELHRKYIWHGLDALADEENVIHTLGFQFAGPLKFQEFFLDCIAAWQREHRRKVHVALETSRNITDAILADKSRAGIVDVIDLRYWQYLADGSLFAPDGKGDRAFRELRTARFGQDAVPPGTPEQLYRQVREYTENFPDKAVVAAVAGVGPIPVFMAGGAGCTPGEGDASRPADRAFLNFASLRLESVTHSFRFRPDYIHNDKACCVSDAGAKNLVIYSVAGPDISLLKNLPAGEAVWFNPQTGDVTPANLGDRRVIHKPTGEAWLLNFRR